MDREDIIRLAREVGYPLVEYEGTPYIPPLLEVLLETVRADEREACAKVCETTAPSQINGYECAAAIRARGQA